MAFKIIQQFNLDISNVSINGEVRKRRGRMKLNTTAYAGTPDINTVTVFDGDFVPSYEIIATAGEDIRKYNNVFDIATNIKQGKEPSITEILDIENNMQTFDTLKPENKQYLLHADMIEQARNMFLNLGIKQLLDEDNNYIKD